MVSDRVRAELLRRIGLADLLVPAARGSTTSCSEALTMGAKTSLPSATPAAHSVD